MEVKRDAEADRKLLRNARSEARIVFVVWLLSLVWVVGYCYLNGYNHSPEDRATPPKVVLGFPDWVFWGIMVPWVICSVFTICFGLAGMTDDDLGREKEEEGAGHGH